MIIINTPQPQVAAQPQYSTAVPVVAAQPVVSAQPVLAAQPQVAAPVIVNTQATQTNFQGGGTGGKGKGFFGRKLL